MQPQRGRVFADRKMGMGRTGHWVAKDGSEVYCNGQTTTLPLMAVDEVKRSGSRRRGCVGPFSLGPRGF